MVNISIRKSDKAMGDKSLFISFDFSYKILDLIKSLPSRIYNANTKEWEVPLVLLDKVKYLFNQNNIEFKVYGTELLNTLKVNYSYNFKTNPLKHQLECIDYGLMHNSFLLGDEMGLGKTKEALDLACIRKQRGEINKCLIICGVNVLKFNWLSEIKKHTNEKGWILGMRKKKNGTYRIGTTQDKLTDLRNLCGDCFFMITNIETLRNKDFLRELIGKKKEIQMVVLDEAHMCKNETASQTKGLLKIDSKYKLALSGTFLLNKPLDLYVPLYWTGYYKESAWKFSNSFVNKDAWGNVQGLRNLDLLRGMLQGCMLRRTKQEVLDLPEKSYIDELIEMTDSQREIYEEVMRGLREQIDLIKLSKNPLASLIRARQATDYPGLLSSNCIESAKLNRMVELVKQISDNGHKCLVFSNWAEVIEVAKERLKEFNPAIITGEYNDVRINQEQDKFKNDNTCKVACGTIGKMGTGLTLTEANYVIFLDEPWNKGKKNQAEDRTHRIGQKNNVTIITLMCKDSIDERVHTLVEQKGAMTDIIMNDKVDISKVDVDFLLS